MSGDTQLKLTYGNTAGCQEHFSEGGSDHDIKKKRLMWKCLRSVVRASEFYHDASLSGCLDSCALSGPAPVTASGRDRAQEVCKGQVFFFFFLYIGLHHFPLVPEAYSVVFTSYKRLGMASKAAEMTSAQEKPSLSSLTARRIKYTSLLGFEAFQNWGFLGKPSCT